MDRGVGKEAKGMWCHLKGGEYFEKDEWSVMLNAAEARQEEAYNLPIISDN